MEQRAATTRRPDSSLLPLGVVLIEAVGAPVRRSDIARRRTACGAVLVVALAAMAGPAAAQVGPRVVSLYPVSRDVRDAGEIAGLLEVALHRLTQRDDSVALATPLVPRAACGPARSATPACLARIAGDGLVVRAVLQPSGRSAMLVALHAVDGRGRSTGPVSAAVDTFIQTAEPLVNALRVLLERVDAGERLRAGEPRREPVAKAPPPAPAAPRGAVEAAPPQQPQAMAAPPAASVERPRDEGAPPPAGKPEDVEAGAGPAPVEKPDLRAAEPRAKPAVQASLSQRPPERHWMRRTGPWVAGAGAVLLAGSAAVSFMNHSLSSDLEDKLAEGRLTPADRSDYDRVELYNTVSKALFASGGALAFGGLALWTAPLPSGPAVAGVSGTF